MINKQISNNKVKVSKNKQSHSRSIAFNVGLPYFIHTGFGFFSFHIVTIWCSFKEKLLDYSYSYYKQLGSGLNPQSCLYLQVFWDELSAIVCDEFNNFQDSKLIFMISDFKTFPIMLLRQLNCGVLVY